MAVQMEEHFIAQCIVGPSMVHVIDFQHISILERQFTPATLPLLLLQESRSCFVHHGMLFQSLTPVFEVSVIRACVASHLFMPLDFGFAVQTKCISFGCAEHLLSLAPLMPVRFLSPRSALLGVSFSAPPHYLVEQDMVASTKDP